MAYDNDDAAVKQNFYLEEKDAEYARRVEQELRDEELARQLAEAEERALAAEERAQGPPPRRPWTTRRACSYGVPLVIVIVGVVALLYAMQKDNTNSVPNLPTFGGHGTVQNQHDPWQMLNSSQVAKWNNGGHGLKLQQVNALDSRWEPYFYQAVSDWDNGNPDCLDLSTSKTTPDSQCEPIDGKSKVCNGDYGNTQWRGINQALVQNGYIVASTSKMNDYYVTKGSSNLANEMQYTMCHEMGHSFGLPHWDENFFNKDLGTCMDYTIHPGVNKQPNKSNFIFLKNLYGVLPSYNGTRRDLNLRAEPTSSKLPAEPTSSKPIPNEVRSKLRDIVPRLENSIDGEAENHGWRQLYRSRFGEAHEYDLGDGWTVEVYKIFVAQDDDM